jgi:hypothetical protein
VEYSLCRLDSTFDPHYLLARIFADAQQKEILSGEQLRMEA